MMATRRLSRLRVTLPGSRPRHRWSLPAAGQEVQPLGGDHHAAHAAEQGQPPAVLSRWTLAGLGVFLGAGMVLLWPALLHPTQSVPGIPRGDIWNHLWLHWWIYDSLVGELSWPHHMEWMNYPFGGTLFPVDMVNGILLIPLRALLGPLASFNLLCWLQLGFAGFGGWVLAGLVARRPAARLVGGLAVAFSSYMISFAVISGVTNRLTIGFAALFLYFFVKAAREGGLRGFVAAGLGLGITGLGCFTHALAVYVPVALFCVYLVVGTAAGVGGWAEPGGRLRALGRLLLARLAPLALACALGIAPVYWAATRTVRGEGGLVSREDGGMFAWGTELVRASRVVASDYVMPFGEHFRPFMGQELLYCSVFAGWVVLLLALLSLFSRARHARFFLPAAVFCALLSLGTSPHLTVGAPHVDLGFYQGLARVLPYLGAMDVPSEFAVAVLLCLAVAAAAGAELLLAGLRLRREALGFLVLGSLVLGEQLVVGPAPIPAPTTQVRVPEFHRGLRDEPGDFAVFDFPFTRQGAELRVREYFFYQTVHRRPVALAVDSSWVNGSQFWKDLGRYHTGGSDFARVTRGQMLQAQHQLWDYGFRYVVLHHRHLRQGSRAELERVLGKTFGAPTHQDEELTVFTVTEPRHELPPSLGY